MGTGKEVWEVMCGKNAQDFGEAASTLTLSETGGHRELPSCVLKNHQLPYWERLGGLCRHQGAKTKAWHTVLFWWKQ